MIALEYRRDRPILLCVVNLYEPSMDVSEVAKSGTASLDTYKPEAVVPGRETV
jgi:hypothetical protein